MSERWIWNQYWHFDRIASCFDDAGARNYDPAVASGWPAFFEALPTGAAILDLCTGNGAVAIMAAEASRRGQRDFRIVAVDQADIDPRLYVKKHEEELAAIDFRGGTSVEALPFTDDSFDGVVSQYGIEYSDLPRSLAELGRVVAPGGRARLVLHAAEGTVAAVARRVLAEAEFLLEEIDLVGAAQACFRAVTASERDPMRSAEAQRSARERLGAFEQALRQTGERIGTAADPAMLRNSGATLLDLFNRRGDYELAQLIDAAENVRTEFRAHRGRLAALIDAAVSREQRRDIASRLREAGATKVEEADQIVEGALIGHIVEAHF